MQSKWLDKNPSITAQFNSFCNAFCKQFDLMNAFCEQFSQKNAAHFSVEDCIDFTDSPDDTDEPAFDIDEHTQVEGEDQHSLPESEEFHDEHEVNSNDEDSLDDSVVIHIPEVPPNQVTIGSTIPIVNNFDVNNDGTDTESLDGHMWRSFNNGEQVSTTDSEFESTPIGHGMDSDDSDDENEPRHSDPSVEPPEKSIEDKAMSASGANPEKETFHPWEAIAMVETLINNMTAVDCAHVDDHANAGMLSGLTSRHVLTANKPWTLSEHHQTFKLASSNPQVPAFEPVVKRRTCDDPDPGEALKLKKQKREFFDTLDSGETSKKDTFHPWEVTAEHLLSKHHGKAKKCPDLDADNPGEMIDVPKDLVDKETVHRIWEPGAQNDPETEPPVKGSEPLVKNNEPEPLENEKSSDDPGASPDSSQHLKLSEETPEDMPKSAKHKRPMKSEQLHRSKRHKSSYPNGHFQAATAQLFSCSGCHQAASNQFARALKFVHAKSEDNMDLATKSLGKTTFHSLVHKFLSQPDTVATEERALPVI